MNTLILHIHSLKTCAFFAITTGIAIRYLIGQRRFYRRGVGGLQHFSRYWKALLILFIEWLFYWLANMLIVAGLLAWLCSTNKHRTVPTKQQENKIDFISSL